MNSAAALVVYGAVGFAAVGAEIVRNVRQHFYQPERAAAWAEKHARLGSDVTDADQFESSVTAALAELGASHTAYFPPDSLENAELRSLFGKFVKGPDVKIATIGVDVAMTAEGAFVRHVFADGAASRGGLLRGDRIAAADGKPFHPVNSFRGKHGKRVRLQVERRRGEALRELIVVPALMRPSEAWLAAQERGSRVVESGERRIGYHYMYSCAGPRPLAVLERVLREKLADADALVLDLRDGWGGCPPELVNLFARVAPTLSFTDAAGKQRRWATGWTKPVVLLVNENSRSGKELVAFAFQKHKLGPIVGRRTGGAFLSGRPLPLKNGGLLYLAVEDVEVDGVRLEGKGVPPDVEVEDVLAFAEGRDPQLERALEVAAAARGGSVD